MDELERYLRESYRDDTRELGELRELTVCAERMTALLVSITAEYFLFGVFEPDTLVGQARFALRSASLDLRREFQ